MSTENRRVIHQGEMRNFEVVVEGFISSNIEATSAEDAIWKHCGRLEWYRRLKKGSSRHASVTDEAGNSSDFTIKIASVGIRITPLGEEE